MGHHPDDFSIEEILEKEAIEKAMQQAEKEAEELRYTFLFILFFKIVISLTRIPLGCM